jgi:membrane-associated phospholipid phosphatase
MQMRNSPYYWASGVQDQRALARFWLLVLGAVYLSTYWLSNQLTHLRTDVGTTVFAWERAIPFVEWTIVPYLSIVLFFVVSFFVGQQRENYRAELNAHVARLALVLTISLICFALAPLRYTFERPATTGLTGLLFDVLHTFDMPYNRAPSLHIGVLVLLWARFARCAFGWLRIALAVWFALIGVSVLTTYQHHVIDVFCGFVAGGVGLWATNPLMNFARQMLQSARRIVRRAI